jgi:hypothetical protein
VKEFKTMCEFKLHTNYKTKSRIWATQARVAKQTLLNYEKGVIKVNALGP